MSGMKTRMILILNKNINLAIPNVSNPDTVNMMQLKCERASVCIKELNSLIEEKRIGAQKTGNSNV